MILDTIAFHTINAFAISLAALLISHMTWSEEHLWNIGVFQTVQLSGLQIADDLSYQHFFPFQSYYYYYRYRASGKCSMPVCTLQLQYQE
jgi:hypothetical protein